MSYNPNPQRRRGTTVVQVAVILGAIALVAIPAIATIGRATSEHLNNTAEGVSDPSKLTGRFGTASGSGEGGSGSDGGGGGSDSGNADQGSGDSGDSGGDTGGAPGGKKKKKSGKRK
jgi:hypothetical protein